MRKIRLMMTIILVLGFTPKIYAQTSTTSIAPPCIVEISPSSAIVYTLESVQFAAIVDGACNEPSFTWEISAGGCPGNTTGSVIGSRIDANGLYTAGDMEGTDIVRVIDVNNSDICTTAEITVTPPPPTTIIICNCDTGVTDMEVEDDLKMSDLIGECASGAKNRVDFVICVSKLTNKWKKDGLINDREKDAIQRCATRFKPVETVDYVDVERYTGLWYQIASNFNPNIGNLAGVTAEYTLNQDGTVKVVNKGFVGGLDGTSVMIEGVARVVDEETNAKLAVSFPEFGITEESEYWIIELGEYYSYAVVTNSQRSSLFILNRRPTMDDATYQDIIDRLAKQCFDPERIILTPQFDEMPPPETVAFVDIERYMGLWYEIARYPVPFDEDGVAVTAEYTLNEDGTVSLINRSLIGDLEGPPNSIEGTARVVDEETNAKLAVTFDRPELEGIEFSYWIIELDEDYQWAVVTNDTRFVLYILSRTSTMEDDVYEDILYRVAKKGFDADRLELTPQPDKFEVSTFPSPVLRTKLWYIQCPILLTGTGTNWTIFPPTIATYDPEDILISIPYVTQFVLGPEVIYDVPYVNPYVLTLLGLPFDEFIEALLAPVDDQVVTVDVGGGTGTFTVRTFPNLAY